MELSQRASLRLSVVIVSWNVAEFLSSCLTSVRETLASGTYEVIVIDNASTDGTPEMLRTRFPWVRLVVNSKNEGFARANNRGIAVARGAEFLFLNPDTVLTAGAAQRMQEVLDNDQAIGMVGPRLLYSSGEIQPSSARLSYSLRFALLCEALRLHRAPYLGELFARTFECPYDYARSQDVEAISGACMLARGELIRAIGGFGECYVHCGEDLELCHRTRQHGMRVHYVHDAVVVHYGGKSSGQASVRTAVNSVLSNHEFFKRCRSRVAAAVYRLIVTCVEVPVIVLAGVAKSAVRRESRLHFRRRTQIAKGLLAWRFID